MADFRDVTNEVQYRRFQQRLRNHIGDPCKICKRPQGEHRFSLSNDRLMICVDRAGCAWFNMGVK